MQNKFKFYFDGYGLQELVYKIKHGLEYLERVASEQNVAAPMANLAERVTRETKYNEGEKVEVTVKPSYGESVRIVVTDSELSRSVYTFNVDTATCQVRITEYAHETKPTTKSRNYDYKAVWSNPKATTEARAGIEIPPMVELYARQAASMITGIKPETIL